MQDETTPLAEIVIVEDQEALAEIYKTRLALVGYKCAVAYDGIQAVVEIEKNRPKLVLLDLMIPKLSGDQVLRIMRSAEWGKEIKVLIISNLNENEAPKDIRDLGIEGYLVKANMTDGQLDQVVDTILKPYGQTQSVTALEG